MDRTLTLAEHLDELRKRALVAIAAFGIATAASVPFASALLRFLKAPAGTAIGKLAVFGPEEAFLVYMKMSFLAGFVIAFPVIAYEVVAFLSPALDERLRAHALTFILACTLAFIAGCVFAYGALIPAALAFLLGIGRADLEPVISASRGARTRISPP